MLRRFAALVVVAAALAGCGPADLGPPPVSLPDPPPVQVPVESDLKPEVPPRPSRPNVTLQGDQAELNRALAEPSPIKFEVLPVGNLNGEEKSEYLNRLLEDQNWPERHTLVLVIFTNDGYDIRFAMGATFFEHGLSVDEMLTLVRSLYLPSVRTGDPAGGLADLVRAVNERLAG